MNHSITSPASQPASHPGHFSEETPSPKPLLLLAPLLPAPRCLRWWISALNPETWPVPGGGDGGKATLPTNPVRVPFHSPPKADAAWDLPTSHGRFLPLLAYDLILGGWGGKKNRTENQLSSQSPSGCYSPLEAPLTKSAPCYQSSPTPPGPLHSDEQTHPRQPSTPCLLLPPSGNTVIPIPSPSPSPNPKPPKSQKSSFLTTTSDFNLRSAVPFLLIALSPLLLLKKPSSCLTDRVVFFHSSSPDLFSLPPVLLLAASPRLASTFLRIRSLQYPAHTTPVHSICLATTVGRSGWFLLPLTTL
ncbi:predicted protein [Histoplasma capsulatum H143]|uniref:Uncharacterized protein n=1 Tax=Ajellomyces capsulatus (strain H143) TaxID=544712 RepID=C6HT88_AJECH|nr:predicted protein [Histoplasma capsulatum H143]